MQAVPPKGGLLQRCDTVLNERAETAILLYIPQHFHPSKSVVESQPTHSQPTSRNTSKHHAAYTRAKAWDLALFTKVGMLRSSTGASQSQTTADTERGCTNYEQESSSCRYRWLLPSLGILPARTDEQQQQLKQ